MARPDAGQDIGDQAGRKEGLGYGVVQVAGQAVVPAQQGSGALTNQDVASELKLADEQKKKLTDLGTEYDRKQGELFRGDGDQQERFAKLRELRTERDSKSLEVLTAEQKEKFTALKGSPFDVSQLGFGRGGQRGKN